MKASDYVADFLVEKGVKYVFAINGGCIVNIIDSIAKHPCVEYICPHHEQAGAIEADAYSRISEDIGVALTTSGPGATNLLTGMCCSYFDSTPTLLITGQVPLAHLKGKNKIRQYGFQETDVINTFKPNAKYVALIDSAEKIKYELEKAFYLAKSGRPGPAVLDFPDDIQRANIDIDKLKSYRPRKAKTNWESLEKLIDKSLELIEEAERPIIILGNGIRSSKSQMQVQELVEKLQFPIALTWAAIDLFPDNYPLSVRDFGVTANRPGNFAVQNSDLILALGTRLDTHETGSKLETFAREAKRIVVDIDKSEIEKYGARGFRVDIPINHKVEDFLYAINKRLSKKLSDVKTRDISNWMQKINEWKKRYPICPKKYFSDKEQINPYVFLDVLSQESKEGDIIIPEAGCNVTWAFQGFKVKGGQRLFTSFNHSPMGYGLPAAIGASFASNKSPVIPIVGDGGIMMNEHEMATIVKHDLPIKIFVMNNEGYGMMKQTQDTWLDSRYEASSYKSLFIPDMGQLAKAHGIEKTTVIRNHSELKEKIRGVLDYDGPILCDVRIHPNSRIYPKLSFGKPIEDSEPLLSREEFRKNMIIEPIS